MPFVVPAAAAIGSFVSTYGAAIAAGTAVVGTGVAAYGQRQQAQAAKTASKYNAKQSRLQAGYEAIAASENARRQQDYNRRVIGQQRAAMAQSGMAPTGTPLVQLGDTASSLQMEILDIGHAASLRSRSLIAGADMGLYEGQQQADALNLSSWGTLASGLSSASSGYLTASGNLPSRNPSSY